MPKEYSISRNTDGSLAFSEIGSAQNLKNMLAELEISQPKYSTIEAINPIDSSTSFFVFARNSRIVIAENFSAVRNPTHVGVDAEFVINNIFNNDTYGFNTIWRHVKNFPPGSKLCVNGENGGTLNFKIVEHLENLIDLSNDDAMSILADEIGQKAESIAAKKIVVQFSGGRDSLGLLTAAQTTRSEVSAITWTYDRGSAHEDLITASDYAKQIGVRHTILDICPSLLLQAPKISEISPTISTSIAFIQFKKALDEEISSNFGEDVLVLDGHGGDHVYLDPVPLEVILDARREGLVKKLQIIRILSQLNGVSFYQLFRATSEHRIDFPNKNQRFLSRSAFDFFAKSNASNRTGKEAHHLMMRQAIHENSIHKHESKARYFSPFTSKQILGSVWSLSPHSFFSEQQTRIPFEDSFFRFNKGLKLRKNKGHITGAFQHAIRIKKNKFKELIGDGYLGKNNILNVDEALSELSKCSLGYGGLNAVLLKALCFELMLISS